jgi:hypothetical protein
MIKIPKSESELQGDFREAIDLLERACRIFDHDTFSAAKQISNLLHQLVDDRGANKAHLTRLGYRDALNIWQTRYEVSAGSDYKNTLSSVLMGIGRDKNGNQVARAYHLPNYLEDGNRRSAALLADVETWLDSPAVRLASGDVLSRRMLIRYVRDQDAGAHSDAALDQLYDDMRKSIGINPDSSVQIAGKNFMIGDLLKNPSLAAMRQIAHELLSSIYTATETRPQRNPHCRVFLYNEQGYITVILQPRGYNLSPMPPAQDLLKEY